MKRGWVRPAIILLLIAALAWVDVIRSSLGAPDMMMTMFMPMTMADGLACREIARLLSISEHTVRKHRSNMLAKLDLRNAPRLIAYARGRGWLAPAPDPPGTTAHGA